MYCQRCGQELDEGTRFCTFCGKPQDIEPEPWQGQTQQAAWAGQSAVQQPTMPYRQTQAPQSSANEPQLMPPLQATAARHPGSSQQAQPLLQSVSPRQQRPKGSWTALAAVLALLAVVVGLGFSAWRAGFNPFAGRQDGGEVEELPAGQPIGAEAGDSAATEEPPSDDSAGSVPVRDGLADYSWEELSGIAAQIEGCMTSGEAISLAQDYHLLDEAGRYGTQTKSVLMGDGRRVDMRLVGVWHDTADTTSGHAGLTFLANGISYSQPMSSGTTTPGGWEGSLLRSWMRGELYGLLPAEVADHLQPVYKLSNNAGQTTSLSSVSETLDTLWAPSIVELCGPVRWDYYTNPGQADFYNAVFNAEGTQYAAFSQASIRDADANQELSFGGDWWLRSTAASTGRGRYVDAEGIPARFGDSNETHGVVFGFCL